MAVTCPGATIAIAVFTGGTFLVTAAYSLWRRSQHFADPLLAGAWLKHDVGRSSQERSLAYTLELDFSNPGYGTILLKKVTTEFKVERYLYSNQEGRVRAAEGLIGPHKPQSIEVPLSVVSLDGPPDQVPILGEEDMHVTVEYSSGHFRRRMSWRMSESAWKPEETVDKNVIARHFLVPYMKLVPKDRWYLFWK